MSLQALVSYTETLKKGVTAQRRGGSHLCGEGSAFSARGQEIRAQPSPTVGRPQGTDGLKICAAAAGGSGFRLSEKRPPSGPGVPQMILCHIYLQAHPVSSTLAEAGFSPYHESCYPSQTCAEGRSDCTVLSLILSQKGDSGRQSPLCCSLCWPACLPSSIRA